MLEGCIRSKREKNKQTNKKKKEVRGDRIPVHRVVGIIEVHGTALLIAAIFSLEIGSRSEAVKEERQEKWKTEEKKNWEREV